MLLIHFAFLPFEERKASHDKIQPLFPEEICLMAQAHVSVDHMGRGLDMNRYTAGMDRVPNRGGMDPA